MTHIEAHFGRGPFANHCRCECPTCLNTNVRAGCICPDCACRAGDIYALQANQ